MSVGEGNGIAEEEIETATTKMDVAVSLAKGGISQIPFVGSILAEIVGNIIPNQRVDRIDRYMRRLADKVSDIEADVRDQKFREPTFVDLFEDGAFQAARALNEERIERIASLVRNGLTVEQKDRIQFKHLLNLLGELNEVELLLLKSYGLDLVPEERETFFAQHQDTLAGPAAFINSPREIWDQRTVHQDYKEHMTRMGLLRPRFRMTKKGDAPEFDQKTGMLKASGYEITPLGRLLLRRVDLSDGASGIDDLINP